MAIESLFITRLCPFPPTAGVPLRVAGNVAALARLGPVDVVIVGDELKGQPPTWVRDVMTVPAAGPSGPIRGFAGKLGGRHPLAASLHSPAAEEEIRRRATGPGLVVLSEVWLAPYLEAAGAGGRTVIYDSHNVETVLRRQIAGTGAGGPVRAVRREVITAQVRRLEAAMTAGTRQTWACSDDDRNALRSLFESSTDIRVVPNGVDTGPAAAAVGSGVPEPPDLPPGRPRIVFLGDLAYAPNEDGATYLLRDVLPLIRARRPDAQVLIVGRRPTAALIGLAASTPGVTVTGEVDEVLPYLVHADVLAVTLRIGGGTRLKILEAMAARLPVVTTSKGLEGIGAISGREVLVADDPAALADAVVAASDPAQAAALTSAAFELVQDRYSWDAVARQVADAVGSLTPATDLSD